MRRIHYNSPVILTYFFLSLGALLMGALRNPYVLGLVAVSVWNACNDPTTAGLTDSARALRYTKPAQK